jgi:hypothetical protein
MDYDPGRGIPYRRGTDQSRARKEAGSRGRPAAGRSGRVCRTSPLNGFAVEPDEVASLVRVCGRAADKKNRIKLCAELMSELLSEDIVNAICKSRAGRTRSK